jgi:hypothetical protein
MIHIVELYLIVVHFRNFLLVPIVYCFIITHFVALK